MGAIWITEQGAEVTIEQERLVIRKAELTLAEHPLRQVERVHLLGNISVTTPAIRRLLGQGSELIFLGSDGQFYARLVGGMHPHTALRRAQYRLQSELSFALALAQRIVVGKLRNERVLLQRHARSGADELQAVLESLAAYETQSARTRNLHSLNGVEGSATARYFSGYRLLLEPPWDFPRRSRQPPLDPVNVMLSLGYTFLARASESAVETTGLDPYLGFLHQEEYNRPSLAVDLMEEFRPVIDGLVLHLVGHGVIKPEDFRQGGEDERPVVMEREAVKRYIAAYEERMARPILHPRTSERLPLWRFLEVQARELARCLREGTPDYHPCVFR